MNIRKDWIEKYSNQEIKRIKGEKHIRLKCSSCDNYYWMLLRTYDNKPSNYSYLCIRCNGRKQVRYIASRRLGWMITKDGYINIV